MILIILGFIVFLAAFVTHIVGNFDLSMVTTEALRSKLAMVIERELFLSERDRQNRDWYPQLLLLRRPVKKRGNCGREEIWKEIKADLGEYKIA
jgi:hypothetical protein